MGWFLARENFATRLQLVPDLARYPELRWLDRFDAAVPALLAVALYALGAWLERAAPALGTSGAQLLVWGFCVSTVALYHATFTINSLAHRFGSRRYATRDDSRNNPWLALLTFGEGWHNNHHHFPGAARQGFYWWEVDLSYYGLRLLAALGLVRDLRPVPAAVRAARREPPREGRSA
jgi:stearoyl-CoA desaturase (delta-9 desaturase)